MDLNTIVTGLTNAVTTGTVTQVAATTGAVAVHIINWSVIGSILVVVIPLVIGVVTTIIKLYGEKTKISEQVLRESPVIVDMKSDSAAKLAALTQRINENMSDITEKIKDVNATREVFRQETTRAIEMQRSGMDELKAIVLTMRSDLEILRNENSIQSRSIEQLRKDNEELVEKLEGLIKELFTFIESNS